MVIDRINSTRLKINKKQFNERNMKQPKTDSKKHPRNDRIFN